MKQIKEKIEQYDFKNVDIGTWTRLIMMILTILIYVGEKIGVEIPYVSESVIGNSVVAFIGIFTFLQCFWKNNSFSKAAQEADQYIQQNKEEL